MSLFLLSVLAFSAIQSAVRCQPNPPILSQVTSDWCPRPFNVTCDLRRLESGMGTTNYDSLCSVSIFFRSPLRNKKYPDECIFSLPKVVGKGPSPVTKAPAGRNWKIFNNIDFQSTNFYQQYVMIQVNDPKCEDEGTYRCVIHYRLVKGTNSMMEKKEDLKFGGKCP